MLKKTTHFLLFAAMLGAQSAMAGNCLSTEEIKTSSQYVCVGTGTGTLHLITKKSELATAQLAIGADGRLRFCVSHIDLVEPKQMENSEIMFFKITAAVEQGVNAGLILDKQDLENSELYADSHIHGTSRAKLKCTEATKF